MLRAELAGATPAERERLLHPGGKSRQASGVPQDFTDALDQAEWEQFMAEFKAERHFSDREVELLLAEAEAAAEEEVARRVRAGTLRAS